MFNRIHMCCSLAWGYVTVIQKKEYPRLCRAVSLAPCLFFWEGFFFDNHYCCGFVPLLPGMQGALSYESRFLVDTGGGYLLSHWSSSIASLSVCFFFVCAFVHESQGFVQGVPKGKCDPRGGGPQKFSICVYGPSCKYMVFFCKNSSRVYMYISPRRRIFGASDPRGGGASFCLAPPFGGAGRGVLTSRYARSCAKVFICPRNLYPKGEGSFAGFKKKWG